jgi:ribosomal protein S18 acetylase RimI-like enzyme
MIFSPDIKIELAGPNAIEDLLPLVAAYHAFEAVGTSPQERKTSIAALLHDESLGGIWQIKSFDCLIGYIAICYSYSIEFGGRDAFIDEFYIDPSERGKGIGSNVLMEVSALLRKRGIVALHLEVDGENERAKSVYAKAGFSSRDKYYVMSLVL